MFQNYLSKLLTIAAFTLLANCAFAQLSTVTVNPPSTIAGPYYGKIGVWSPQTFSVTGDVVYSDDMIDTTGTINDGCSAITNVSGKVALIDRGLCGFAIKAVNAQQGGAIAIIICNNAVANPYATNLMGGVPTETITIPGVMLSYNDCLTIKAELANGVNVTLGDGGTPALAAGEGCSTAEVVGPGTHTTPDMIAGQGGYATNGHWYSYTPAATNLATVSSCGAGINTRLFVVANGCAVQDLIDQSIDECEISAGGALTASDATFVAFEGVEYLILWDDASDYHGFNWTLSEGTLPNADVTFTVDMQYETVDPAGAFIAGTFATTPVAMTANGDGTYSYTASVQVASELQWRYLNGPVGVETSADLEACGVPDVTIGGFNRVYTLVDLAGAALSTVCFNSCDGCTPTDCGDPIEILDDNLDSYVAGPIGPQAAHWSTWSGTEGGAEDGVVSIEQSSTPSNSMKIEGTLATGGAQDVLLLLGDKTSGHYILSWDYFVPTGKGAYYNIQHLAAAGAEYGIQVNFNPGGTGAMDAGAANAKTFTFPHDAWFSIVHYIDLDNDWTTLYINNQFVYGWPFSWTSFTQVGTAQLSSIDFFPRNTTDKFYVDDIYLAAIPAAADGQYCHKAVAIEPGLHTVSSMDCFGGPQQANVNARGAAWYSYTPAADGYIAVGSCGLGGDTRVWIFSGDCGNRLNNGLNDDECEQIAGSPDPAELYASYKETAVTAGTTYYIVWDNRWTPATPYDFELTFFTDIYPGDFCQTAIPAVIGTQSIDYWAWSSVTGPNYTGGTGVGGSAYTNSKWYSYTPTEDLILRAYSCDLTTEDTRIFVYTGDCSNHESLTQAATADDDCGTQSDLTWAATAGTTYIIEWDDYAGDSPVHDWTLESMVPTVAVTFQVDLTWQIESGFPLETVKIAGNFGTIGASIPDWSPTDSPAFTDIGDDIYEVTIEFPLSAAGETLQYKFLNTADSWGASCDTEVNECFTAAPCATVGDNRTLEIPATDLSFCYTYNTCVECNLPNATTERLDLPMTIAPNPFSNQTLVTFHTPIVDAEARLTTVTGKLVRTYQVSGQQLKIERDALLPGIYFLNVVTEDGVSAAEKLIVQ